MPRFPLIPTLIVGAAIAAMIALGVWQLQRRAEKQAALALYAANMGKPAMAWPRFAVDDSNLFRRASAMCLEVVGWRTRGAGGTGWRHIAECRTGAEGPLLLVDMGVARDPAFRPRWRGGEVTGTITHAPDNGTAIGRLFRSAAPRAPMLVSEAAAPGLEPSARPNLATVPNNHLAYAVQWFFFALVAGVIYLLALRRRQRKEPPLG